MKKPDKVPLPWTVGYGSGLTGPNTPVDNPFVDTNWPYIPISQDKHTVAIIPAQESGEYSYRPESKNLMEARAHFITTACNSHAELLDTIKNALVTLAIINMPIQVGALGVTTNTDLMSIMEDSFRAAIAKGTEQ